MAESIKKNKTSLRTRLLLSTLPAIIALLLTNNFITEYFSRRQIVGLIDQNLIDTSSQIGHIYNIITQQIKRDIENLSQFPLIYTYFKNKENNTTEESEQALETVKNYIRNFIKINPMYISAVLIDNDKNVVLDEYLPSRPFSAVFPDFLFDAEDHLNESHKRVIYLPIVSYPEIGLKVQTVTFPLMNDENQHKGYFVLNIDWTEVEKQIEHFRTENGGYVFMTELITQRIVSFPPDPQEELKLELKDLNFTENPLAGQTSLTEDSWNGVTSLVYSIKTTDDRFLISASVPKAEAFWLVNKLRLITFFITLLVTALVVLIIWGIAQTLTKKISSLVRAFQDVAHGDLTKSVKEDSQDEMQELAEYFNSMTFSLSKLVERVRISCKDVQAAGLNIEDSSHDVNVTFEDFETFSMQISKSIGQISHNLQRLFQDVHKVSLVIDRATVMAKAGQQAVDDLQKKVEQVTTSFTAISGKLININLQTSNINEILQVMTSIADRTNLLSLNASLEAVHAGEYGKGFGVVAQEIRYLSDQVNVSAEDIEQVISNMEKAVHYGVEAVNSFAQELKADTNDIRKIGAQLTELIQLVETLGPNFSLLTKGVEEQTVAAKKIDDLVTKMNTKAKGTTSALQLSKISVNLLSKSTEELEEEISRFNYIP